MALDVDLELFLGGVWTDVPLYASPVTITRGHDPFGNWPRPTRFECEIDNDTLAYDPSRPASLLYGAAGRNTRARIRPAGTTRVWAEASEWLPHETSEHVPGANKGRAGVALTAEGLLRRIGTWSDQLRSPMYRTNAARSTSVGHWSLEEQKGARSIANSSPGRPSGTVRGALVFGEDEAPFGAASTVRVATGTQLSGQFVPGVVFTTGWQIFFSMKLAQLPPDGTYRIFFRWTTSNGYTWYWDVNNASYRINVRDDDGTLLHSQQVSFGAGAEPNQWVTFRLKASISAGTVTVEPAWYAQGQPTAYGTSGTFSGSLSRLSQWWQEGNSVTEGAWFSHVGGVAGVSDSLVGTDAQKVFNGYLGEEAAARFLRVMGEAGLTRFTIGGGLPSVPMGPQRPGTLLDNLREIRATDGMRIDDERLDIALTQFLRRALYNQTPALALTYPTHIRSITKEIADRNTHNRVTVVNRSGGEFTAVRETGPMSVLPPPAGVGDNPQTIDVNVADDNQLPDLANWWLARGTLERPVYPEITIDLIANPGLIAAATAIREGNMITLTGKEPDLVRLLVVGIKELNDRGERLMTFQCEPYDIFHIAKWDDPSFRYDSRTATVNSAQTTTSTNWSVKATSRDDTWSTATPYQWMVGGELVTVTAMSAVTVNSLVSYTQTATVVRSVNGVVKPQTIGTEIHIADARRWGL